MRTKWINFFTILYNKTCIVSVQVCVTSWTISVICATILLAEIKTECNKFFFLFADFHIHLGRYPVHYIYVPWWERLHLSYRNLEFEMKFSDVFVSLRTIIQIKWSFLSFVPPSTFNHFFLLLFLYLFERYFCSAISVLGFYLCCSSYRSEPFRPWFFVTWIFVTWR